MMSTQGFIVSESISVCLSSTTTSATDLKLKTRAMHDRIGLLTSPTRGARPPDESDGYYPATQWSDAPTTISTQEYRPPAPVTTISDRVTFFGGNADDPFF